MKCAIEDLPLGQMRWLMSCYQDAQSFSETTREWGWRGIAGIDGWVESDPNASDELKEELVLLCELAKIFVRSPRMDQ